MSNPKLILNNELSANYVDVIPPSQYMLTKRFFDIAIVLLTAPITLPFMAIISLLVKLESKGPIIFKQIRVGINGEPFEMYKIRSMTTNSEEKGSQFAQKVDLRVTRIGKFIRKMRIDEIPQFINILKGDMSLIGPRPEQIKMVEEFERSIPHYNDRHIVAPGITGLAQTVQGYVDDKEGTIEKLKYDLHYIQNISFGMDIQIIYRTIITILTGFGSR